MFGSEKKFWSANNIGTKESFRTENFFGAKNFWVGNQFWLGNKFRSANYLVGDVGRGNFKIGSLEHV